MRVDELAAWDSFCVIVGSSAGALIGLQFIVLTLVSERPRAPSRDVSVAFSTPTIVHFGAVLLLCAMLRAPFHSTLAAATAWGILGFAGIVYMAVVLMAMRRQKDYAPEGEDWLFHIVLPGAAYAMLAGSSFAAARAEHEAMFIVAAASLFLLFAGIHNAWDTVTWHVATRKRPDA